MPRSDISFASFSGFNPEAAAIIVSAALFLLNPKSYRDEVLYISPEQVFHLSAPCHREVINQYRGVGNMLSTEKYDLYYEGNVIGIPMELLLRLQRLLEIRNMEKWNFNSVSSLFPKHRRLASALTSSTIMRLMFYIVCLGNPGEELYDKTNVPSCLSRIHGIISDNVYSSAPSATVLFCRNPVRALINHFSDHLNVRGADGLLELYSKDATEVSNAFLQLQELLITVKIWSNYNGSIEKVSQCSKCRQIRTLDQTLSKSAKLWEGATGQQLFTSDMCCNSTVPSCCSARIFGCAISVSVSSEKPNEFDGAESIDVSMKSVDRVADARSEDVKFERDFLVMKQQLSISRGLSENIKLVEILERKIAMHLKSDATKANKYVTGALPPNDQTTQPISPELIKERYRKVLRKVEKQLGKQKSNRDRDLRVAVMFNSFRTITFVDPDDPPIETAKRFNFKRECTVERSAEYGRHRFRYFDASSHKCVACTATRYPLCKRCSICTRCFLFDDYDRDECEQVSELRFGLPEGDTHFHQRDSTNEEFDD